MIRHYLKERGLGLALKSLALMAPVLAAIIFIHEYGPNEAQRLEPFGKIEGNTYSVNFVVIIFMLCSFVAVFLSLISYGIEAFSDLSDNSVNSKRVRILNGIAISVIFSVGLGLAVVTVMVILSASGGITERWSLSRFETLMMMARWFAFVVFGAFMVVDLCFVVSQRIQRNSLNGNTAEMEWKRKKRTHNMEFGINSILMINLPMLLVSGLVLWLNHELMSNVAFRAFHDLTFGKPLTLPRVADETYELFANGLDAGILSATVLLSQLIFVALQFQWGYKEFVLKAEGAAA